ncbi:MAG: signal peptidase I [Candidatus Nanohaloarchaea archaeon]
MEPDEISGLFESRSSREFYFICISLILAFGILQTTGQALQSEKPVVSVTSCSMYPELHVGDILIVDGRSFDSIESGDVVVYNADQAKVSIDGEKHLMATYNSSRSITTDGARVKLGGVGSTLRDVDGDRSMEPVKFARFSVEGQRLVVIEGDTRTVSGVEVSVSRVGSGIPVVHRAVDVGQKTLETRGDNNRGQIWFEERVSREQVHGEVAFVVPRVGGLKMLAMDLLGFNGDRPLVVDAYPMCEDRS